MVLTNIEIYWYDMLRVGPSDNNGVIRCENIQLGSLTGPPEYRLGSSESWVSLTADGFNWRFETTRTEGSYSLEIRDSSSLDIVDVIDIIIQDPDDKAGRDSYIDVINNIQITRNQVVFTVSYPNSYFDETYVWVNGALQFISPSGRTFNWTDLAEPETDYFRHVSLHGTIITENGAEWTIERPPEDPANPCDLFVSDPTIKRPSPNQANGEITVNATSSGNITYSIDGSAFQISNVFTGLPEGTYIITIADDSGNCSNQTQEVILTDKYFRIAKLNAIEFKIPDGLRPNFNNTLFVDRIQPNRIQRNRYCQVFFDNELIRVQFQSNIESHEVKVYDYESKAELGGIVPQLIYNSPEGFAYWEFSLNPSAYTGTTIQLRIIPANEIIGEGAVGISEPLSIISEDSENKYVKVQYLSNVNCSDMYFVSGISPFLYFEGEVADTLPILNKEVSRDCEWNVNTQSRELIRKINVKASRQPYYIHEKLQWALGNGQGPGNFYAVNDMWVNSEDAAWEEPDFPDKYSLGDSAAKLEQRDLFTGDLSETPAPPVTINYLLVNPDNNGGLLVGLNDEYLLI